MSKQENDEEDQILSRYSDSTKRGCPTCDGVDPRSCMRCRGKTQQRHWFLTRTGYAHHSELSQAERELINSNVMPNSALDRSEADK